eukprot:6046852-Pleurochrysis_carterae.AAC.1
MRDEPPAAAAEHDYFGRFGDWIFDDVDMPTAGAALPAMGPLQPPSLPPSPPHDEDVGLEGAGRSYQGGASIDNDGGGGGENGGGDGADAGASARGAGARGGDGGDGCGGVGKCGIGHGGGSSAGEGGFGGGGGNGGGSNRDVDGGEATSSGGGLGADGGDSGRTAKVAIIASGKDSALNVKTNSGERKPRTDAQSGASSHRSISSIMDGLDMTSLQPGDLQRHLDMERNRLLRKESGRNRARSALVHEMPPPRVPVRGRSGVRGFGAKAGVFGANAGDFGANTGGFGGSSTEPQAYGSSRAVRQLLAATKRTAADADATEQSDAKKRAHHHQQQPPPSPPPQQQQPPPQQQQQQQQPPQPPLQMPPPQQRPLQQNMHEQLQSQPAPQDASSFEAKMDDLGRE